MKAPGDGTCCGVQREFLCEGCPYEGRKTTLDNPRESYQRGFDNGVQTMHKELRKAISLIDRALPTLAREAMFEMNAKAGLNERRPTKARRLHREAVELLRELSGLK